MGIREHSFSMFPFKHGFMGNSIYTRGGSLLYCMQVFQPDEEATKSDWNQGDSFDTTAEALQSRGGDCAAVTARPSNHTDCTPSPSKTAAEAPASQRSFRPASEIGDRHASLVVGSGDAQQAVAAPRWSLQPSASPERSSQDCCLLEIEVDLGDLGRGKEPAYQTFAGRDTKLEQVPTGNGLQDKVLKPVLTQRGSNVTDEASLRRQRFAFLPSEGNGTIHKAKENTPMEDAAGYTIDEETGLWTP